MGVALGSLLEKKEIGFEDLKGKTVGIDSYNIFYQFLSIIRSADGTPLMDSHGNITSHLSGLLYRTLTLLENDIKPVYVFDGKPHKLKHKTIRERAEVKERAEKELVKAREAEDVEAIRRYAQQTARLTEDVLASGKKLISLMGLPSIQAPSEGEAQVAVMVDKGKLFGCVSQDFDALLFGTKYLLRNLTVSGKRKLPGKTIYREIKPEMIGLQENLQLLGINRKKLVWLSILIGTDFNEKFPKIGPKTALKLVKEHDSFEGIIKETNHEPGFDYKEIEDIFLKPEATEDYKLEFRLPDREGLTKFLVEEHDFSQERVANAIERLEKLVTEKKSQKKLGDWH